MKLPTAAIASFILAGTAVASIAEQTIVEYISQLEHAYGSISELESWATYISTHKFTTPSDIASLLSLSDVSSIAAGLSTVDAAEFSDFVTQYYPGSILQVVAEITAGSYSSAAAAAASATSTATAATTKSASASSESSASVESANFAVSSALPAGLVVGLSGLAAAGVVLL